MNEKIKEIDIISDWKNLKEPRKGRILVDKFEELFYLTPKELAIAINKMPENELLEFSQIINCCTGSEVDLMQEKLQELSKYLDVNSVFMEAYLRLSLLATTIEICGAFLDGIWDTEFYHALFVELENLYADNINIEKLESHLLFAVYPAFRKHFPKLKEAGIVTELDNGFIWNCSKISLAEYFDSLKCDLPKRKWKCIEDVFYDKNNEKFENLRQYFFNHNEKQNKPSIDFEKIKQILELE